MKILVTGGGGFLGSAICRQLLARGDEVLAYQRRPARAVEAQRDHDEQVVPVPRPLPVHVAAHVREFRVHVDDVRAEADRLEEEERAAVVGDAAGVARRPR